MKAPINRIVLWAVLGGAVVLQQPAQAQVSLAASVVGSGGGVVSGPDHRVMFTIGQPVVGFVASDTHQHGIGFWYLVGRRSARAWKAAARTLLTPYLADPDQKVRNAVTRAVAALDNSLDAPRWVDTNRLDGVRGGAVFDDERKAVKELDRLLKDRRVPGPVKDIARAAIDHLVAADKILASIAVSEAGAACAQINDPEARDACEDVVDQARNELDRAADELNNGRTDKAIHHFKKAWEHAQTARTMAASSSPAAARRQAKGHPAVEAAGDGLMVVHEAEEVPETYALERNYPNPFNPQTVIRYALPEAGAVRLVVYDVLGRTVATLVATHQAAGRYRVTFDASRLPSGVYFYSLKTDAFAETRPMVLAK